MVRRSYILASILGALAVGLGAFGAHSFKSILLANDTLNSYQTAVSYQFYHSFALFAVGWASSYWRTINFKIAIHLFFFGTCLFSGSLYVYALSKITVLVMITPVGGIILISAWLLTLYKLISESNEQSHGGKSG